MVDERTAYWGERDAARYRTRDDDPTGGDYVVAETLDANGDPVNVLLRWDDTAGEWVSGGPVNMNGNDLTNVGSLDAGSVSTEALSTKSDFILESETKTVSSGEIAATNPFIRLQSEDASSDTLTNISNIDDGKLLILSISEGEPNITVADNGSSGPTNILLKGGDFTLTDGNDKLTLFYDSERSNWNELSRSDNN